MVLRGLPNESEVDNVTHRAWLNEYFGYFYGKDEDLGPAIDAVAAAHPGKPIPITENGTWPVPGHHGGADVEGTEERQAEKFRKHSVMEVVDFTTERPKLVHEAFRQAGRPPGAIGPGIREP